MFRRGVTTGLLLPQIDTDPGAQEPSVEAQLSAVHGPMYLPEAELVQKSLVAHHVHVNDLIHIFDTPSRYLFTKASRLVTSCRQLRSSRRFDGLS